MPYSASSVTNFGKTSAIGVLEKIKDKTAGSEMEAEEEDIHPLKAELDLVERIILGRENQSAT